MHIINKQQLTFSKEAKSYLSHFVPRGTEDTNVTINSLIDIFTILLIFLLKSYSSAGFTIPLTPGISIPKANFYNDPLPSAILSVTTSALLLDGKEVVTLDLIDTDELTIHALDAALEKVKRDIIATGKLNPTVHFTGNLIIEADRQIPFKLLQKILFTCGQTGFDKINLAVIKEGD